MLPSRLISSAELARCNGENGRPAYIAYQGVVYDVTGCPRWRKGLHERMHFPGQDLTDDLADAPHKADVFTRPCVQVVGRLAADVK